MRLPENYPPEKHSDFALSLIKEIATKLEDRGNDVHIGYMQCEKYFGVVINKNMVGGYSELLLVYHCLEYILTVVELVK